MFAPKTAETAVFGSIWPSGPPCSHVHQRRGARPWPDVRSRSRACSLSHKPPRDFVPEKLAFEDALPQNHMDATSRGGGVDPEFLVLRPGSGPHAAAEHR